MAQFASDADIVAKIMLGSRGTPYNAFRGISNIFGDTEPATLIQDKDTFLVENLVSAKAA